VEIAFRLGVDPRKATRHPRHRELRTARKSVRVAVFAQGEKAQRRATPAPTVVGRDDLVDEVMKGTSTSTPRSATRT